MTDLLSFDMQEVCTPKAFNFTHTEFLFECFIWTLFFVK